MRRILAAMLLTATPAGAQWLSDPAATPPYVSTPGDVTSGGVVSGAEGSFLSITNSGGGEVYAPAGVSVDPGSLLCLDEPTCNFRIYKGAANLVINGAGQPVACIDGFAAQGVIEAGTLQPNSCEMAGGATACTVRAASGTGATTDAKLLLQAGAPDGVVEVVNGAGLRSARIGNADAGYLALTGTGLRMPTTAASGECSQATGGYWTAHVTEVRPDAGVVISPIWCNGGEKQPVFIFEEFAFSSAAPGGGGLGPGVPFRRKNPERAGGQIAFGHVDVLANGGPGGNTYTVDVLQNGVVLCSLGPINCAATGLAWDGRAVAGSTGDPPCPGTAVFVPRTAADGPAFNITVQFAGTCSTWPTVTGAIDVKLINLNSVLP